MEPLGIYLGLKVVPILVLWGRSIFYLGTSALRVSKQALTCVCVCVFCVSGFAVCPMDSILVLTFLLS